MSPAELTGAEYSAESFTPTVPAPARKMSRLLGSPSGELAFSILTGEHKGRQVRIRGAKCTIGSGRGCTLRLRARGIQPVHCWILRGAGGTIVRRRHRDTQLNGCTFEDSILSPGDRLRIGSVELEVTACPTWSAGWSAETSHPTPVYDELDRQRWERTTRESSESIDRLRGEMQNLERRATSQLAELNSLVGRVSTERDSLQDQLRRTEYDASSQRDTFFLDKQRLESSLAAAEQELGELKSHLTSRESEIESVLLTESRRVNEIQNRLEDVLRERSNLEARLHEQTSSLREECAARQVERDNLQEECQRLDAELARLRELVGYTAAERDHLTLNASGAQQLLAKQQDQLHRENRDLQARLETTQDRLTEAERRLAVVQVEGDSHLQGEMERVGQLQERLERTEREKGELESQLRDRTNAWQAEQVRLSEQQGRLSEQCVQLEGQLKYVRELVESLASEKQLLCEQLEAADLKLAADQEAFAQERTELAQKLTDAAGPLTAAQQRCEQLEAELNERRYGNDTQAATWKQQADEYEEQIQALCEQLATTSGRLAELQSAGESNNEIDSVLATKWQHEAEVAREEVTSLKAKLADIESRPAAPPSNEQSAEWERRAGELQVQLTAAELRSVAAEDRLAEMQAKLAERDAQMATAQTLVQKAAEGELARETLTKQLSAQSDAIQFERETWQQDRERLHQECRMLGHRLIQKQKEYDALDEQVKAAAKEAPPVVSANTITMEQIRDEVAAATELEEERANWWAERDELRRQVDELTAQLAARPEFTQQMTMGPEAIADLQAQARAGQEAQETQQRVAALELELESARCQLDESRSWHERADAAINEVQQHRSQNHQLREELAELQRELAAAREAVSVAPAAAVSDEAQLAALDERERQRGVELEQAKAQLAAEAESLNAARQQLAAQQQEQQQTQAEFEGRWKLWEENLRRQEDLLQKQADELAQRVAAAESRLADSANLEQSYAVREEQLLAEAARLAELRGELEREQAELAERAVLVDSQPAALEPQQSAEQVAADELPQQLAEADEAEPPIEVRDSAVPEHFAPQFVPGSPPTGETPKPVWNQPGHEPPADDDSIEAYMSRLLKRVRGDSHVAAPAVATPAPKPAPIAPTPQPVEIAPVQVASAPAEPVKPEEYVPRQKAPELTTNMAAMRELANSAARTAIVKHQKRSGSQQAMMQSVGALLTLVCGLVAAFGAYYFHSLPGAIAAGIGLAVALYWGGKAAIRVLGLMMLKAPGCKDDHDEPTPVDAPNVAGESLNATAGVCPPEPPADPTETLHPDYIAPELSQSQEPSGG